VYQLVASEFGISIITLDGRASFEWVAEYMMDGKRGRVYSSVRSHGESTRGVEQKEDCKLKIRSWSGTGLD
jgi:hypothetical protein